MMRKIVSTICLSFLIFCVWAFKAEAASLYFSPSSKQVSVGNIIDVKVLVDTQGQAINNSDAVISYPTDLLDVVSTSQFWINFFALGRKSVIFQQ